MALAPEAQTAGWPAAARSGEFRFNASSSKARCVRTISLAKSAGAELAGWPEHRFGRLSRLHLCKHRKIGRHWPGLQDVARIYACCWPGLKTAVVGDNEHEAQLDDYSRQRAATPSQAACPLAWCFTVLSRGGIASSCRGGRNTCILGALAGSLQESRPGRRSLRGACAEAPLMLIAHLPESSCRIRSTGLFCPPCDPVVCQPLSPHPVDAS